MCIKSKTVSSFTHTSINRRDMENYTSSDVPISASCGRSAAQREEAIWLFGAVLAVTFAAGLGATLRRLRLAMARSARAPSPFPLPSRGEEGEEGKVFASGYFAKRYTHHCID